MRRLIFICAFAPLLVFGQSQRVLQGQTPAPIGVTLGTGCHIATPQEVSAGARQGAQVCPSDAAAGITKEAGEAKQYLRSILCNGGRGDYGGAGPDQTIAQLNNPFAVCAAKFLKFANDSGKGVCINEGFRTVARQNLYAARYQNGTGGIACTYGAECEHPKGIAIDVNTSSGYEWLWNNACQFGVDFYLRSKDRVHFVPTTHSVSRGKSSCGGTIVAECFDPNFVPQNYGNGPSSSSPSSGGSLAQSLRSLFQPEKPQQVPQIPQQTPPSTAPQGFQESTSSPRGAVENSSGTIKENTSTGDVQTTGTQNSLLLQQILLTGSSSVSTSSASTTPLKIEVTRSDAAMLRETTQEGTTTIKVPNDFPDVRVTNTFVSNDLGGRERQSLSSLYRLMELLTRLRDTLLKLVSYLKPLSHRTPPHTAPVFDSGDSFAE
ncbi:hypothetical protein EBR66_04650 [bacterium]|nr:hypothetical protein [bacterium]